MFLGLGIRPRSACTVPGRSAARPHRSRRRHAPGGDRARRRARPRRGRLPHRSSGRLVDAARPRAPGRPRARPLAGGRDRRRAGPRRARRAVARCRWRARCGSSPTASVVRLAAAARGRDPRAGDLAGRRRGRRVELDAAPLAARAGEAVRLPPEPDERRPRGSAEGRHRGRVVDDGRPPAPASEATSLQPPADARTHAGLARRGGLRREAAIAVGPVQAYPDGFLVTVTASAAPTPAGGRHGPGAGADVAATASGASRKVRPRASQARH